MLARLINHFGADKRYFVLSALVSVIAEQDVWHEITDHT